LGFRTWQPVGFPAAEKPATLTGTTQFMPYGREQAFLLPPHAREWRPADGWRMSRWRRWSGHRSVPARCGRPPAARRSTVRGGGWRCRSPARQRPLLLAPGCAPGWPPRSPRRPQRPRPPRRRSSPAPDAAAARCRLRAARAAGLRRQAEPLLGDRGQSAALHADHAADGGVEQHQQREPREVRAAAEPGWPAMTAGPAFRWRTPPRPVGSTPGIGLSPWPAGRSRARADSSRYPRNCPPPSASSTVPLM
jgi:hypothetical protein